MCIWLLIVSFSYEKFTVRINEVTVVEFLRLCFRYCLFVYQNRTTNTGIVYDSLFWFIFPYWRLYVFQAKGASIGDTFLVSHVAFHDRRIPIPVKFSLIYKASCSILSFACSIILSLLSFTGFWFVWSWFAAGFLNTQSLEDA